MRVTPTVILAVCLLLGAVGVVVAADLNNTTANGTPSGAPADWWTPLMWGLGAAAFSGIVGALKSSLGHRERLDPSKLGGTILMGALAGIGTFLAAGPDISAVPARLQPLLAMGIGFAAQQVEDGLKIGNRSLGLWVDAPPPPPTPPKPDPDVEDMASAPPKP